MIFNIVALLIGLMILGAGIYYLMKEKEDKESRKIYGITILVGAVITVLILVRVVMQIL